MCDETVLNAEQVRAKLKKACAEAGGQRRWARLHRVSSSLVTEVLMGRRSVGGIITTTLGLVENPRTWRLDDVHNGV